jgi:hypothetical protein
METVMGKERPSTLTSMKNLAEVLSEQGKYDLCCCKAARSLGLRRL